MEITHEQVSLLEEMFGKLGKLGIKLGYLRPNLAVLNEDCEFIVRLPMGEYEVAQLLHKDDIIIRTEGNILVHEPVEDPKHDDQVQSLLDTINEALLEGEIYFDPAVTRQVDGFGEIHIVQRDLTDNPRIQCFLYELPLIGARGNVWTYAAISQLSEAKDKRFQVMKKIIDEVWPEESDRLFRSQVADQADQDNTFDDTDTKIFPAVKEASSYRPSKLMRNLLKWLGMG